ncbi:hypothetical protein GCM10023188_19270 [Pontibacter saemangeumensis]|uniref:Heme NO-binding domain-containing protein n=1 Tax=Pontibacter saemangeumensis TaxID=1084525 RepID=A0ABP8LLY9_9BACT
MEKSTVSEDTMHGSMFVLLKRFIEGGHGYSTWVNLLQEAGIKHAPYQMDGRYPTGEMAAIVGAASRLTGTPPHKLMEQYGEALVPDLLLVYRKYIQPEWRTYDMLLHTEGAMHAAVKREDSRANPPMLLVTKKGARQLIVDYHSRRRMAGVAVGIIKGIAAYFHEGDLVEVTLLTPVDGERVQVRVDFLP